MASQKALADVRRKRCRLETKFNPDQRTSHAQLSRFWHMAPNRIMLVRDYSRGEQAQNSAGHPKNRRTNREEEQAQTRSANKGDRPDQAVGAHVQTALMRWRKASATKAPVKGIAIISPSVMMNIVRNSSGIVLSIALEANPAPIRRKPNAMARRIGNRLVTDVIGSSQRTTRNPLKEISSRSCGSEGEAGVKSHPVRSECSHGLSLRNQICKQRAACRPVEFAC